VIGSAPGVAVTVEVHAEVQSLHAARFGGVAGDGGRRSAAGAGEQSERAPAIQCAGGGFGDVGGHHRPSREHQEQPGERHHALAEHPGDYGYCQERGDGGPGGIQDAGREQRFDRAGDGEAVAVGSKADENQNAPQRTQSAQRKQRGSSATSVYSAVIPELQSSWGRRRLPSEPEACGSGSSSPEAVRGRSFPELQSP